MAAEVVFLKDLAATLGLDRSNLRKYCLKHGFIPKRGRCAATRWQSSLVLTEAQAKAVVELRRAEGFIR